MEESMNPMGNDVWGGMDSHERVQILLRWANMFDLSVGKAKATDFCSGVVVAEVRTTVPSRSDCRRGEKDGSKSE
ncbi:unnamed protein product [Cyprideis torosa]|uniref:Uncharacterized protein n=1 Tax=Cyprideis torosa TaxID=163714 RepID=A0A7R8WT28_9CRUS|nr:unnamed protein product [Cyprideis torosa]CAG0909752.1 unnamed protein product [Cyprideis torosa]